VAFLGELIEKLARPAQEIRAEHLREWAAAIPGTVPIADAEPRCPCKIAGVIQNVRIDPREGSGSIEATINDGTGRMLVKWLGRQKLAGISLGAGLICEGTVGVGPGKLLQVLNPEYQLVPEPEHG
jgi:hypothetical protein